MVFRFFFGGTPLQASSAAVASSSHGSTRTSQTQATRLSNMERLEAIGYKIEVPKQFEDPISFHIIDDPINLNGYTAQTIDKSSIPACHQEGCAGFFNPLIGKNYSDGIIEVHSESELTAYKERYQSDPHQQPTAAYYTHNAPLKNDIDSFVSTLEHLHYLIKQLDNLLCPIDDLASLFENVSLSTVSKYIDQQKCERVETIQKTKQTIIDVLINFIRETEAVINKHELTSDELIKLNHQILTGPKLLQNLLIVELEHLALLPIPERYNTAIIANEDYKKLIFYTAGTVVESKNAQELQAKVKQRITSLEEVSLAIKLQAEIEAAQKPTPSTTAQLPLFLPCLTLAQQLNTRRYLQFLDTRRKLIQTKEQVEQSRADAQAAVSAMTAASAAAAAATTSVETAVNPADISTFEEARPAAPRSPSLRRSHDDVG